MVLSCNFPNFACCVRVECVPFAFIVRVACVRVTCFVHIVQRASFRSFRVYTIDYVRDIVDGHIATVQILRCDVK